MIFYSLYSQGKNKFPSGLFVKYWVSINYRRILLRHNLSRKCRKIVKFVSITHSVRTFGMVQ